MESNVDPWLIPQNTMVRFTLPFIIKGGEEPLMTPMMSTEKDKYLEKILEDIVPPTEWEEDAKVWRLELSREPATRLDVIKLDESLSEKLKDKKYSKPGICIVRYQLYADCFDELIRQCSIVSVEHGSLLLRIREELRRTFSEFESVCGTSVAFGERKALFADEAQLIEKEAEIVRLKDETKNLNWQLVEAKKKLEEIQSRTTLLRDLYLEKFGDEIARLKQSYKQLDTQYFDFLLLVRDSIPPDNEYEVAVRKFFNHEEEEDW